MDGKKRQKKILLPPVQVERMEIETTALIYHFGDLGGSWLIEIGIYE
jgi:hypothetical protein